MAIYPNNPPVSIRNIQKASNGVSALSEITLGSHTGTHIDAPLHIDPVGLGPEVFALDQFVGSCDVVDITQDVSVIHAADIPQTTSPRVLFKTQNSSGEINVFDPDFTALAEDAAEELIRRGVRLIGIDALSIKKKGVKDRVHELFLKSNIVIIEGLWLHNVTPGPYELICMPLSIAGIDGVPARAILRV